MHWQLIMKYKPEKAGQWIHPVKRGYKMMCCDCSLVHVIDFDHIKWGSGRKIRIRVWRDNRATAAARRKKK